MAFFLWSYSKSSLIRSSRICCQHTVNISFEYVFLMYEWHGVVFSITTWSTSRVLNVISERTSRIDFSAARRRVRFLLLFFSNRKRKDWTNNMYHLYIRTRKTRMYINYFMWEKKGSSEWIKLVSTLGINEDLNSKSLHVNSNWNWNLKHTRVSDLRRWS